MTKPNGLGLGPHQAAHRQSRQPDHAATGNQQKINRKPKYNHTNAEGPD
jgi:hypothetical protein